MRNLSNLNIHQLARLTRNNPLLSEAAKSEAMYRVHQRHMEVVGTKPRCSLPKKQQRAMGLLPKIA